MTTPRIEEMVEQFFTEGDICLDDFLTTETSKRFLRQEVARLLTETHQAHQAVVRDALKVCEKWRHEFNKNPEAYADIEAIDRIESDIKSLEKKYGK